MKAAIAWVVCLSVTSLANAELLAPKGAKAQLKVEYVFTSSGKYTSPAKDVIDNWSVRRVVNMTALYAANAPQAVAVLHADDPAQKAQMASVQARAISAQKKLEPMQNDVMAMMAKCGISMDGADVSAAEEKAQEACMEKAAFEYGSKLEMTPDIKSAGADIAAIQQTMSGTRFQLWQLTSQSGTYSIDETVSKQVFEMTCTETKVCKRVETTKGGGAIPGGKSVAGCLDAGSRQHRARHDADPAHADGTAADHDDGGDRQLLMTTHREARASRRSGPCRQTSPSPWRFRRI